MSRLIESITIVDVLFLSLVTLLVRSLRVRLRVDLLIVPVSLRVRLRIDPTGQAINPTGQAIKYLLRIFVRIDLTIAPSDRIFVSIYLSYR